jgi:hypothetical protein
VRPGRDADPSPPSNAEVKNRVIPLLSLRAFVAYERVKPTYSYLYAAVLGTMRMDHKNWILVIIIVCGSSGISSHAILVAC